MLYLTHSSKEGALSSSVLTLRCTLCFCLLSLVWSVTEQTLPPETAASSSDQARNKPRNNQQDQRRVHLSWRHNTWSETRSLCLLNSFERALPNAASSLCFLQCCTVRLPGAAAVVFFISLVDHFLSLFNTSNFHPLKKKNQQILLKVQYLIIIARWALIQTFSTTMDTMGTPMVLQQHCVKLGLLKNY